MWAWLLLFDESNVPEVTVNAYCTPGALEFTLQRVGRVTTSGNKLKLELQPTLKRELQLPPPPKQQFQSRAVRIRTRHPFFQQIELRRKPLPQFVACRAEGRAILVGNQVVDREILPVRLQ